MDERTRRTTARKVRQIIRSAAEDNVLPLHAKPAPPPPRRRPPALLGLVVAPFLALIASGHRAPAGPEPVRVAAYSTSTDCGAFKFQHADCDPNQYIIDVVLKGGNRARHDVAGDEDREFPVF